MHCPRFNGGSSKSSTDVSTSPNESRSSNGAIPTLRCSAIHEETIALLLHRGVHRPPAPATVDRAATRTLSAEKSTSEYCHGCVGGQSCWPEWTTTACPMATWSRPPDRRTTTVPTAYRSAFRERLWPLRHPTMRTCQDAVPMLDLSGSLLAPPHSQDPTKYRRPLAQLTRLLPRPQPPRQILSLIHI